MQWGTMLNIEQNDGERGREEGGLGGAEREVSGSTCLIIFFFKYGKRDSLRGTFVTPQASARPFRRKHAAKTGPFSSIPLLLPAACPNLHTTHSTSTTPYFLQRLERGANHGGGVARARLKNAAQRSHHRFRVPFLYQGPRPIITTV